jgi:hypothetical protein
MTARDRDTALRFTFTPLRPPYKVENAFARLGMWRRLSRYYEQTALGANLVRGRVRRLPLREAASRADLTYAVGHLMRLARNSSKVSAMRWGTRSSST